MPRETACSARALHLSHTGDQPLIHPEDYLSATVPLLEAEYATGLWDTDDLLAAVLAFPDDFYHGSHTLVHLNRDELQESDCNIEDGGRRHFAIAFCMHTSRERRLEIHIIGICNRLILPVRTSSCVACAVFLRPANAQIAVITGMFAMESYNWRSMVSPGITGLFNKNCLQSGSNNLMTCYPGDNTYDGVNTVTSLISSVSPYHSIYTTEATNGAWFGKQPGG